MDAEKPWETALAGVMFTLCLVMLWALLAMVSEVMHPQERVVSQTENVTIAERGNGR